MTAAVREELIVKIHAAPDGVVWCLDGDKSPRASGYGAAEFAAHEADRFLGRTVRMLGTPDNAWLIAKIFALKGTVNCPHPVEVASPLVCETAEERRQPDVALFRMRQCRLAASLGGWHAVSDLDYPLYAMIAQLQHDRRPTSHVRHYLYANPAWHDLQFIETINEDAVCHLLAYIVDPRFYVDLTKPDRIGKLVCYMGLNPRVQKDVGMSRRLDRPCPARCMATLASWKTSPTAPADIDIPGNFLWRVWLHAGGGFRGDLRASQALIRFLRHTWLQALTSRSWRDGPLFDPSKFFKTREEIEAYHAHAERRSG